MKDIQTLFLRLSHSATARSKLKAGPTANPVITAVTSWCSVIDHTNMAKSTNTTGMSIRLRKIWYPPSISYAGLLITSSTLSDMPLLDRRSPQLTNQNRAAKKVREIGPPYIKALLAVGVASTLFKPPVCSSRINTVFSDLEYLPENSL